MESPRFSISSEQWKSIGRALVKYTAPLLLLFLLSLQQGAELRQAAILVYGAALQLAINILSKFISETK